MAILVASNPIDRICVRAHEGLKMAERKKPPKAKTKAPRGGVISTYTPDMVRQALALSMLNYTDAQFAEFFNIGVATLYRWKKLYPEFAAAIKRSKEVDDGRVVNAMLQRAIGYDHETQTVVMHKGKPLIGDDGKPVTVTEIKHIPGDVTAQKFWLSNRQRGKWAIDPDKITDNDTPPPVEIRIEVKDGRKPKHSAE